MSNDINIGLFERAAFMVDYWTGTIVSSAIEDDLQRNDLDSLFAHVSEAEGMASQEEFYGANAL